MQVMMMVLHCELQQHQHFL